MKADELERVVDLTLTEFMSALDGLAAEDLQQVRTHPVVRSFTYRVCSDAQRRELFPAAEEFYLAQARLADRRWKFQCQKTSIV